MRIKIGLLHNLKVSHQTIYLDKGTISQVVSLNSFDDLADLVQGMEYPKADHGKDEQYGLCPTAFKPVRTKIEGTDHLPECLRYNVSYVRRAVYDLDVMGFMYIDIDNSKPSRKVRIEEIEQRLSEKFDCPFFIYTTRSHTDECHRFRILMSVDRHISRSEAQKIAVWMNKTVMSGQADTSVYDPTDFIYTPPYGSQYRRRYDGQPLDVNRIFSEADVLLDDEPHLLVGGSKQGPKRAQSNISNAVRSGSFSDAVNDTSIRPEISISNPDIFHPSWLDLYRNPSSHWDAMRCILGKVWKMTDAGLTYGEMAHLFVEIDATKGGYFQTKYGADKTNELLRWYFLIPAEGANDNWKPILSREDIGLTIDAVEAQCGEGKTHNEINRMMVERGRYVFAVPKIDDIRSMRGTIEKTIGVRASIHEVHSQSGFDRVSSQLRLLKRDLDRKNKKRPFVIVLTTHAAMLTNDWKAWSGFELIIDEVPENFFSIDVNIKDYPLEGLIRIAKDDDGACHRVRITAKGRQALKAGGHELLTNLTRGNMETWVQKSDWASRSGREVVTFFSLYTPKNLAQFKAVRLLGDEATKSITLRIWQEKWGVKVNQLPAPSRPRVVPISERLTIRYFSEQADASLELFIKKRPDLLKDVADFIVREHPEEDILWTANERLRGNIKICGTYITPRSHGRNDLQHHAVQAWLTAMKPSQSTANLIKGICGMTYQDLVGWREYNVLYQFAMRGNLRDPDSDQKVIIYVFSKKQADYLSQRMGGIIEFFGDKLPSFVAVSAPKTESLTEAERQRVSQWAKKMILAGATKFEDLPDTVHKQKVDPKLIPAIEALAERKMRKCG